MNRHDWRALTRDMRANKDLPRRRWAEITVNGTPYTITIPPNGPMRIRPSRMPDRHTRWLIARELADAAEERRRAADPWRKNNAIRAHRLSIRLARKWRGAEWRDAARAAAA